MVPIDKMITLYAFYIGDNPPILWSELGVILLIFEIGYRIGRKNIDWLLLAESKRHFLGRIIVITWYVNKVYTTMA